MEFFDKVLVLSPHTDDGELGAGGTIARIIDEGLGTITFFAFSAPKDILRRECQQSLKTLGIDNHEIYNFTVRNFPQTRQKILEILFRYNQENKPSLILTPSRNDIHQDHQVITNEAIRAFKHSTILGYELPWNNIHFDENCFVILSEAHVEKKIEALMNYQTQINKRLYFKEDYLRALIRTRGVQIGERFAEAFEIIKLVI